MVSSPLAITPLGGAREIGANSYHLDLGGAGLLLDSGLHPKLRGKEAVPRFDRVSGEVDAVLVSHAHLDHVGALPVALRRFPRARVYMTPATARLAVRMLRNAVTVARRHGQEAEQLLFGHDEVEWVERVVAPLELDTPTRLDLGPGVRARVTFLGAGHLLGAAGILLEWGGRRVFYSGDTCASGQYICGPARYPEGPLDLLVLDSTHGQDPLSDPEGDRRSFQRATEALGRFITRVAEGGGSVLLPVFAMGRTQEILGVLHHLTRAGSIPSLPIHVSGLAESVCRIYDATRRTTRRHHPELELGEMQHHVLQRGEARRGDLLSSPRILAATSGMMMEGTASHTLAARMMESGRHGVGVVGYVDPSTPAYRVLHAREGEPVDLGGDVGTIRRRCAVQRFPFSAHSRASQLLDTVAALRPERVLLVHGDSGAVEALARGIRGLGSKVWVAEPGQTYRL